MRQLRRNVCLLSKHIVRICEGKCFSSFEAKYCCVAEKYCLTVEAKYYSAVLKQMKGVKLQKPVYGYACNGRF